MDVTKGHFLGVVEYAQHNFARLEPLLYSEGGRAWETKADAKWFPYEGLVFSIQSELRYALSGSHWHFRVAKNLRGEEAKKDTYTAVNAKPATELHAGSEPLPSEELRIRMTETGLDGGSLNKGAIGVPEAGNLWVLVPDIVKSDDGRWRAESGKALRHLKVLSGTPEELCGLPTPAARFFLPPSPKIAAESRNWLPPQQFVEELAGSIRRWIPHGPLHPLAQSTARSLKELAPHLGGLVAMRAEDAKAAMLRAQNLTRAAEALTEVASGIVDIIVDQEPFRREVNDRRERIRKDLEAEALLAIEEIEAATRERLRAEHARVHEEIELAETRLSCLKDEVAVLEVDAKRLSTQRNERLASLDRELALLLDRAATKPAKLLADWLGVSGFMGSDHRAPGNVLSSGIELESALKVDKSRAATIAPTRLGPTLFAASPASNEGDPWLLVMDAALRARELPLLIGPMAREYAEAWMGCVGGTSPYVVVADPTLLSLSELSPAGPRGSRAPLAAAFEQARSSDDRTFVILIDDPDPASAAFWLPELARCQRHPDRYGFPPNVLFLAVMEGDPRQMELTRARAGELFPMEFLGGVPTSELATNTAPPFDLPLDLVCPPHSSGGAAARISSFRNALAVTFKEERATALSAGMAAFVGFSKGAARRPTKDLALGLRLATAADKLSRERMEPNDA